MKISIQVEQVLQRTTSHVIATNRNHVQAGAPPGRTEMIAAYAALRPGFAQKRKLYRLGHGPTDGRLDHLGEMDGYHFEAMWGKDGPYPYDDLRHGLREARELDADVALVVNYGSGDAAEAGRLVSYLNRKDDALRNRHGLSPFNVRLFELGNEVGWKTVRGHDQYAPTERAYAERGREFARAMRQNSDLPIAIGVSASINSNFTGDGWESGARAVENIIGIMKDDVDFIVYHGYPSLPLKRKGEPLTVIAQNQWNRQKLVDEIFPAIERARREQGVSHPITVANTEYFTELYDGDYQRGVLEALYTADSVVTALSLGLDSAVNFCFMHADVADSLFFVNDDPARTTPVFAVHQLLAAELGDEVVQSAASAMPTVAVEGAEASGDVLLEKVAYLATRAASGKLSLLLVNRVEEALTVQIQAGAGIASGTLVSLAGGRYAGRSLTRSETALNTLAAVELPAASVSILRLTP